MESKEQNSLAETVNKALDEREQKNQFTNYTIISSVIFLVATIVSLFSKIPYLSIVLFVFTALQPTLPIILKKSPKPLAIIIYILDAIVFCAAAFYLAYIFIK